MPCVCGLGESTETHCLPLIKGERKPITPEELMRSRYAAYVLGEVDYIIESVHPDERKDVDRKTTEIWSRKAKWDRLEIISTSGGGENDEKGEVEFKAHFEMNGLKQSHHEKAEFARHNGRWYFVEGEQVAQVPVVREGPRIGRNDACPCGSGKKYKKCCGKAA